MIYHSFNIWGQENPYGLSFFLQIIPTDWIKFLYLEVFSMSAKVSITEEETKEI